MFMRDGKCFDIGYDALEVVVAVGLHHEASRLTKRSKGVTSSMAEVIGPVLPVETPLVGKRGAIERRIMYADDGARARCGSAPCDWQHINTHGLVTMAREFKRQGAPNDACTNNNCIKGFLFCHHRPSSNWVDSPASLLAMVLNAGLSRTNGPPDYRLL